MSDEPDVREDASKNSQRSRTGCLTCRRRKKKCGEEKPSCEACERLNLDCVYPEPGMERRNRKRKRSSARSDSSESPDSSLDDLRANLKAQISKSPSGPNQLSASGSPEFLHTDMATPPDGRIRSVKAKSHLFDRRSPSQTVSPVPVKNQLIQPTSYISPMPEALTPQTPYYSNNKGLSAQVRDSALERTATPSNDDDNGRTKEIGFPVDDPRHLNDDTAGLQVQDMFSLPLEHLDIFAAGIRSPFVVPSPFPFLGVDPAPPFFDGEDVLQNLPALSLPPSPTASDLSTTYPELDDLGHELFDYFCNTQSLIMSVSPQNNFQKVFAKMAMFSRPVLCGVLSWAAFHRNRPGDARRGHAWAQEASTLVQDVGEESAFTRDQILATLLLVASAKICSGDVSHWRDHLSLAARVIKKYGGVTGFVESESVQWLLKNYAYHEILSSSSRKTPQLFTPQDLKLILQNGPSGVPDTLCACCQPILSIIANINFLCREVRAVIGTDKSVHIRNIQKITEQAAEIEQQIYKAKPDREMMLNLDGGNSKTQFVLFEAFQHLAILYLYDSVLHMNSSSLQIRSINELLLSTIDLLMGTNVEGILTFPLFMAGVTCCVKSTRPQILDRFERLFVRNQARNIRQACALLREVWTVDDMGSRYVDWNELAENKGWHLSFA